MRGFVAGVAQLVEHLTCNQGVASSIPAAGTIIHSFNAGVAQLVEHLTCNQGVASSIPAAGTK